jgi:hypothetical protein
VCAFDHPCVEGASMVSDLHRVEHASAQRRPPESLEAWGLYQRALPLIENFTREDAAKARRPLESLAAMKSELDVKLASDWSGGCGK